MIRVEHGDCLNVLPALAAEGVLVDSVVCDPPYHLTNRTPDVKWCADCHRVLGGSDGKPAACPRCGGRLEYQRSNGNRGFMGKQWDGGDIAFRPETWRAVFDVMKPGAHLIAFSGTRTYHRMVCAIEDAGFEIRDQLLWIYGSGFPKSHDVSKGIDKAAGAERELISIGAAVKRMIPGADQAVDGWIKDNGREFIPTVTAPATDEARQWQGWGTALKPSHEPICLARKPLARGNTVAANVLAHGTGALNIDGCRIGESGARNNGGKVDNGIFSIKPIEPIDYGKGRWPANLIHDGSDEVLAAFPDTGTVGGFPARRISPKTSGIYGAFAHEADALPTGIGSSSGTAARFFYSAKADANDRCGSKHPTVKPTDLMAYLCRLITPPGGTVLDPFAGSGSTGMACLREGFDAILIEREAEYVADIRRRIAHVAGLDSPLFGVAV